jgi:hypothetical protein
MKRTQLVNAVLALLLVALLPLGPAQCVCTTLGRGMAQASAAAPACHKACCSAPRHGAPAQAPRDCPCTHVTASDPPAAVSVAIQAPQAPTFLAFAVLDPLAPAAARTPETPPALDVGSPPLPVDPGAHGLRAPPVSA